MRWLSILILVLFLLASGCVNPSPSGENNSLENTPATSIPLETTNPGATENGTTNNLPPASGETTPPSSVPATFTLADVSAHAQPSDCWTIVRGKVYNITDFVNGHPGGPGILAACGIDGTTLFETRSGNGPHPPSAEKTLEKYYAGELTS